MKPSKSYKVAMAQYEKSVREIAQAPTPKVVEPAPIVEEKTEPKSDWAAKIEAARAAKEAETPEEE